MGRDAHRLIRSLLLFVASLFIGFLVEKYVTCQSRKSDFGWHRFRFSPCLMRKRVEKSEAIPALLDSFQYISSVVYGAILYNFKKPSDIFSPQIERKRSKEYLVIILAVKESFERFSCLEFVFEKRQTPGSRPTT